jgi:epoxyqueuosine reductase
VNAAELATAVKRQAQSLGFDDCRIATVRPAPHASFFVSWIQEGHAGEMKYLERNVEKRCDPSLLAADDQPPFASMVVLGVDYHQFDLPAELRADPSLGLIASYAWGDDYHELIRPLLYELDAFVRSQSGRSVLGKCLVDTGPVLERDWAHATGLGFTGKNCCTIVPGQGSWRLLAVVLVPEVLAPDPSLTELTLASGLRFLLGTCGTCTRCLTACPTNAFAAPYHLDPQRCISYWTIEAPGSIPLPLRPLFGNRIFGCDICQEVCPYNRRLGERMPIVAGLHAQTGRIAPPLLEGFHPDTPYWLDDRAFSDHFVRSPIKRAKRRGMLRNVCVALGNWGAAETLPALRLALEDPHPISRGHAAWALGQMAAKHPGSAVASSAIDLLVALAAGETDTDEGVRAEAGAALAQAFAC